MVNLGVLVQLVRAAHTLLYDMISPPVMEYLCQYHTQSGNNYVNTLVFTKSSGAYVQ